jgi:anti-anti-sigma factor
VQVTLQQSPSATVVTVSGEVDLATAGELTTHLNSLDLSRAVVVDLSDVSFIDSSGLNTLVQLRQKMQSSPSPSNLRLAMNRSTTRRIFDVTGLSDVFEIFDSAAGALASL